MEGKILFYGCVYDMILPSKQLPIQKSELKHKNKVWKLLRMKTLERPSGVLIVNCKHILHFVLIIAFEQANVCWVHIEKTNTWKQDRVYHTHVVV